MENRIKHLLDSLKEAENRRFSITVNGEDFEADGVVLIMSNPTQPETGRKAGGATIIRGNINLRHLFEGAKRALNMLHKQHKQAEKEFIMELGELHRLMEIPGGRQIVRASIELYKKEKEILGMDCHQCAAGMDCPVIELAKEVGINLLD